MEEIIGALAPYIPSTQQVVFVLIAIFVAVSALIVALAVVLYCTTKEADE